MFTAQEYQVVTRPLDVRMFTFFFSLSLSLPAPSQGGKA